VVGHGNGEVLVNGKYRIWNIIFLFKRVEIKRKKERKEE
jgi:hypothetical protein